jgi:hypothetical protein
VTPVLGSNGTQYTVSVNTGSGDGTLGLNLNSTAAISDLAGNQLLTASLSSPTFYATGQTPTWGAIGDVNGDGNNDLVMANYNAGTVGVYLGNGNGTFQTPTIYSSSTASIGGTHHAYLSDLNGDGKLDIVTTNYSDGTVSVLLNNGNGGFQPRTSYATGALTYQAVLADVDGNGTTDLLVSSNSGVVELLGNGDGTFQSPRVVTSTVVNGSIATADFNGDGRPDLVEATNTAVSVFLNEGNGQFDLVSSTLLPAGSISTGLAAGDVNGDGKADVIVSNYQDHSLTILLGDGTGSFAAPAIYSTGPDVMPIDPVLADMNGDGYVDIVVGSDTSNIGVLVNNGNGTFNTAQAFPAGSYDRITVGDLNNDGKPDVVAGNYPHA